MIFFEKDYPKEMVDVHDEMVDAEEAFFNALAAAHLPEKTQELIEHYFVKCREAWYI